MFSELSIIIVYFFRLILDDKLMRTCSLQARGGDGAAAKQAKPNVDLETEARNGNVRLYFVCQLWLTVSHWIFQLEKLTVAVLKELAASMKVQLKGATKKADIITQIKKHYKLWKDNLESEFPSALRMSKFKTFELALSHI